MTRSFRLRHSRGEPPAAEHDEHDEAPPFGALSWLSLLSRATCITGHLAFKAITALPPSRRAGLSFHEYVAYEGMRDYQCGLDAVGIQHLLAPTTTTCRRYARRHKIPYSEIRLPDGTVAAWLGPRNHRHPSSSPPSSSSSSSSSSSKGGGVRVRVLFHGGGYMSPALPDHLDMAFGFPAGQTPEAGVAVVVLEYALASERRNHYPAQLAQAACLLEHLLRVEKVPPARVTLLGDSAGGHLLLGLLLHVRHPNPDPAVPAVAVEEDGRFAGAALVSPWVELGKPSFSLSSASGMGESSSSGGGGGGGGKRDIVTPESLAYWARNLLGGAEADPWNSPLLAPREWWADLPVDEVLVTYGGAELFRDDVARLGEILRSEHPRTTTVAACEGEIHVHMVMNRFLKIRKPCQSEEVFVRWLAGRSGG
ncbi:Alpha/Beta hydrolase protein [Chaetomium strumarium]|uniref:Alpha/Beta hydrolase protein n=1 Tax=Chaetomium strumarium TaxID=1170767 RepID=A0AAJ0GPG2_9PEZI|nr:Alpha/Beta hydrolase protein [Chaetomium strumarium]